MNDLMHAAEQVSLFCRLNLNTKRELPVRSSEMGLLIYLSKAETKRSPMDAARFFKVTKAMVTNMVTSLAKKGYLTKEPDPSDGRGSLLNLTEAGRRLVACTCDEYCKTMSALRDRMGEADFSAFLTLLEQANTILLEEKENG